MLSVFHTPPVAVARNMRAGSLSTTAMSEMRPPMFAGPMGRHSSGLNFSMSNGAAAAALLEDFGAGAADARAAKPSSSAISGRADVGNVSYGRRMAAPGAASGRASRQWHGRRERTRD